MRRQMVCACPDLTSSPYCGTALHALDAKPGMKALLVFGEVGDEVSHRLAEFPLLLRT